MTGGTCNNGNCTRPIYRGKYCFRCWAGVKWTSIVQRVENRNGNTPSYVGVPITFSREELIEWVMTNPPPKEMKVPSIDRIVPSDGYALNNIRWLERDVNSMNTQRDIPLTHKLCPMCNEILPIDLFGRNLSKPYGRQRQSYCKPCRRVAYSIARSTTRKGGHHGVG